MASKRGVVTRTVNTRSASASAGHPVGSEAPTMLPDNFGPRTIMSLPANFLVDPDSVRRRGRRSTPHPQPRQSARETFSEAPSESTAPDDAPSAPPTPPLELSIATIPIETELTQSRGIAPGVSLPPRQTVKINPVASAQSTSVQDLLLGCGLGREAPLSRLLIFDSPDLFILQEVSVSTKFVEDQENLFPKNEPDADQEFYDSDSTGTLSRFRRKFLTVVKDMDGSTASVDRDYSPYIDAPLSTNPDAVFYTQYIEPALLETLEPLDFNFFFTLTVLHVPTLDNEVLVAPLIVLLTSDEEKFDVVRETVEQLWAQNDFDKYLVSISFGHDAASAADQVPFPYDLTTSYHEHWNCGISIGWNSKTATSGAILQNSESGNYYSLTCAHLFEPHQNECVGFKVTQPSFEHFMAFYRSSELYMHHCRRQFQRETDQQSRETFELRYQAAQTFLLNLDEIRQDTSDEYQTENEVASVVQASHNVIDYEGRRCLLDYALLRLDSRLPRSTDRIIDSRPSKGYLAEFAWENDAITVGPLRYDIRVKKRGCATGVTFGIIAGVYGVYKSQPQRARREFWALPEALSTSLYEFGNRGDSGALVWTVDGEAIGIIIAGWTVAFDKPSLHAAILPNRYWDTKNIPFFRDEEDNIDFTGLLTHVVSRPICLIESLEMVLQDLGGEFNLWAP